MLGSLLLLEGGWLEKLSWKKPEVRSVVSARKRSVNPRVRERCVSKGVGERGGAGERRVMRREGVKSKGRDCMARNEVVRRRWRDAGDVMMMMNVLLSALYEAFMWV